MRDMRSASSLKGSRSIFGAIDLNPPMGGGGDDNNADWGYKARRGPGDDNISWSDRRAGVG